MSYQIQLQPGGQTFTATSDRSVLDAALDAGLALPHGCRTGVCGACKARIIRGEADLGAYAEHALSVAEREAGHALLCCARARSDLVIEAKLEQEAGSQPKKLPCRVKQLERLAEDVMRVELQLPATESFSFRAGQYIDILLDDGLRRSFSIANPPSKEGCFELHIRLIPGGHFTPHVFGDMKPRDILRIEGPFGSFWLREGSDKPIVMIGGGTGFAPLKGLVEHAIHIGLNRPIALYWGARAPGGLYLHEMAQSWQSVLPGFRYIPVISAPHPGDGWTGRRGLVHEAVLADFADLSGHEVYACGAPPMIEAARDSFMRSRGLPADAFYADAFTFAAVPTT
ncbi:MAG: CDP-6-deoxy-delta-3,4-glucoseen reductase [Azoarcus sp.]|jgi:CDP-4-dehydro-6-deoxyglucose reductase|nr:CDP-6-deoxy-delta-3,4-glucoseen reductase [Azoarcus sp.]